MEGFKLITILAALAIAAVAVVSFMGLVGEQLSYVCPDGSLVDDVSMCSGSFGPTVYVCPDGTQVNDANLCAKQYVCWDKAVVTSPDLCGVKPKTSQDESEEYWLEDAQPFRIIDYMIAKSTLFMTLKNVGDEKLEYVGLRLNGRPVRLGFADTEFWPTEARAASGSMETRCGDPGKNFSYNISISYTNLDTGLSGLTQTGELPLVGKCAEVPNAVLSIGCNGATREESGIISIMNAGSDPAPTNSINVKVGTRINMLEHPPLPPGETMQVTETTVGEPLTSGVQGEAWVTGGASVVFVCMS